MLGSAIGAFECFLIHTVVPCPSICLYNIMQNLFLAASFPCHTPVPVPRSYPITPIDPKLFTLLTFTGPLLKSITMIQGILTALTPSQIIFPNFQFLPKFLPVQIKCGFWYSQRQLWVSLLTQQEFSLKPPIGILFMVTSLLISSLRFHC